MTDILISPLATTPHIEPAPRRLSLPTDQIGAYVRTASHRAKRFTTGALGVLLVATVGCAGVLGLWELAVNLSDAVGVVMTETAEFLRSPSQLPF